MSSKSDPGYAHRTTIPTESLGVVDIHQVYTENHVGNSTNMELSNKKGNITKKSSLNKININNKTSDVVSNQSFKDNNNMINTDLSISDTTVKLVSVSQSNSDTDSLNNNINIQMNDKSKGDEGVSKSQSNDAGVNQSLNAAHNVHSTVTAKTTFQSSANHQPKSLTPINVTNGPKVESSSMENEVVLVNSHPANIAQKNARNAETQLTHAHNDIVHFVGSAWEGVKFAHYFGEQ